MSEHTACLAAVGIGGLGLAAVLLTPTVVAAGARAGAALLDWVAEKGVRL